MKKLFLVIMITFAISGCYKDIPAQSAGVAGNYQVYRLFTMDSCTVYRFRDEGRSRYFTNCKGSTAWSETEGKTSIPVTVEGGDNGQH